MWNENLLVPNLIGIFDPTESKKSTIQSDLEHQLGSSIQKDLQLLEKEKVKDPIKSK